MTYSKLNNSHSSRALSFQKGLPILLILLAMSSIACELKSPGGSSSSNPELTAFGSCDPLESYLKTQAFREARIFSNLFDAGSSNAYQPMGFTTDSSSNAPTAPPTTAGTPFSETNLQELGVDEADIFKVDATHAFAIHKGQLVIMAAIGTPDENHDPDLLGPGESPPLKITAGEIVSRTPIEGAPFEMFLDGDRVIVMTRITHSEVLQLHAAAPERSAESALVKVIILKVTDRAAPRLEREVSVEGEYLASRRINENLHVVTRSSFQEPPDKGGPLQASDLLSLFGGDILGLTLDSWLPFVYDARFDDEGTATRDSQRADCATTYHSEASPGDEALTVFSINVEKKDSKVKTTTILGDGTVLYASTKSLVVAQTNYARTEYSDDEQLAFGVADTSNSGISGGVNGAAGDGNLISGIDLFGDSEGEEREVTYLHQFNLLDDGSAEYEATGTVDGWILNQFSLSEHKGYIRVATQRDAGTDSAQSMVFVLKSKAKASDPLLQFTGNSGGPDDELKIIGELRNIALGEELFAARFQGDVGYLITFRETDPLWTIDLSNPKNPIIRGELMVPGYSTYIHPIEGDRLLAIGRADWWDDEGIKISLFDVSDLDNPRVLQESSFGAEGSDSEALTEHRAFRYIADQGILAIPMQHRSERGMYLFQVGERGFDPIQHIDHSEMGAGDVNIRRSYRIGNYLYSYSDAGVSITDLQTLKTEVNVPF